MVLLGFFASFLLLHKKSECPMTNPLVVAGFVREEVNTRTYNWGGGGNALRQCCTTVTVLVLMDDVNIDLNRRTVALRKINSRLVRNKRTSTALHTYGTLH